MNGQIFEIFWNFKPPGVHILTRDLRTKTGWSQDQQNFENLGPIRTGRSPDLTVRGSLILTTFDTEKGRPYYDGP